MTSPRNCHVNPTQNSTKIARNGSSCRFMHKKDLTCIKKTSSLFYAWIDMKARNSSPGIFMRKAIVRTKKDHRVPSNLTSFSLISQCLFCFIFFSCKIRVQIERRRRDKKAVYFILIDKTRAVFWSSCYWRHSCSWSILKSSGLKNYSLEAFPCFN